MGRLVLEDERAAVAVVNLADGSQVAKVEREIYANAWCRADVIHPLV